MKNENVGHYRISEEVNCIALVAIAGMELFPWRAELGCVQAATLRGPAVAVEAKPAAAAHVLTAVR